MIAALLSGASWRVGAGVAGVAALVATGLLVTAKIETGYLRRTNADLTTRVEVLSGNLATCKANLVTITKALEVQTAAVDSLHAASEAKLAESEAALDAAKGYIGVLQSRSGASLRYQPKGADSCARADDIRTQYQERLK